MSLTLRTDQVSPGQRAAASRLADAVRRLGQEAVVAELDPEAMIAAAEQIETLADRLPRSGRAGALRDPVDAPLVARQDGTPLRTAAYNPFGIPLDIRFSPAADFAWADLVADFTHEGPPSAVHGGIVAWLMDVVLGVLVQARGASAYTRSLEVTYRRPTPLGAPLRLEARWLATSGRRTEVEGIVRCGGEVTASARGEFVAPRPSAP